MSSVGRGGSYLLEAFYREGGTGALVDPVDPTFQVVDTDADEVLAATAPTKVSVGRYQYSLPIAIDADLGTWTFTATGTINGQTAQGISTFTVVEAGDVTFDASAAPLVTASDLLTYLGCEAPTDGQTARAEIAVDAASSTVRAVTRQTISRVAADTQLLRGTHSRVLTLPQRPVEAVQQVTVQDAAYAGGAFTLAEDSYELQAGGRLVLRDFGTVGLLGAGTWGGPECAVSVTYTHGWVTPPPGITPVVLRVAATMFANPAMQSSENFTDGSSVVFSFRAPVGTLTKEETAQVIRAVGGHPR